MLRTLRSSIGVPAGLLIVLLTMGVALPAALHGDANDDACETVAGAASSASSLRAASPVPAAQHCGVCHWLRSLRVFQTDAAQPMPRLVATARPFVRTACATGRLVLDLVPARAPPA